MSVAAIVLAAGSSSRLGQPKQRLPHAVGTLLDNVVSAARGSQCEPIIVVVGAVGLSTGVAGQQIQQVHNPQWSTGIGSSIRVGIAALLADCPEAQRALILLCDQPAMNAALLERLLDTWQTSGRAMAACQYGGTLGPPCGFDRSRFDALANLPPDRGAKSLLGPRDAVAVIDWPDGELDIDTPEDLRRWRGF